MTRPLRGSLQPKYCQQGFSLLELLIYIAILTIATLIIAGTFISINRGSSQTEARSDVNGNLRFAMERISQDIRAASSISTPTTTATAFDSDGIAQSDPTSGEDVTNAITADSQYLYVAGYQTGGTGCALGSFCWRIEKRDVTTGALVTAFDGDGIAQSDPSSDFDIANAITADSQYLYIAGYETISGTDRQWRIEKRDKTTGVLITAFDGDGVVKSDLSASTDIATAITADSSYLYIAGYQSGGTGCTTGAMCWRIEKRDITTGALVTAFDGDGIAQSDPSTIDDEANAIAVDSNYLYVAGFQNDSLISSNSRWRIEKRDKTTGALCTAANCGTAFGSLGIVQSDPTTSDDKANAIAVDSSSLYVAGQQATGAGCATGSDCWRIEKRDITTGALVTAFDGDGIAQSDPTSGSDIALAITMGSSSLYIAGYQATGAGCSTGSTCWRVEKRDITTGTLVTAFDGDGAAQSDPTSGSDQSNALAVASQYIYVAGQQATGAGCATGGSCWRIEKRFLSDGALANGAYGDTTSTIAMTVSGSTVTYCVANGQLRRQVTGSCTASSEPITADTVWVETPLFTRLQNTNATLGKTIVSIEMRLTAAASSTNPDAQFTSTKKATASMR